MNNIPRFAARAVGKRFLSSLPKQQPGGVPEMYHYSFKKVSPIDGRWPMASLFVSN
jgi:hypothetical protein